MTLLAVFIGLSLAEYAPPVKACWSTGRLFAMLASLVT